jgi:hypothetical protein
MQWNLVYKGVTRGKCLPRSPATASSVRPGAPDCDPHAIMKPRNADCSCRRAPASDFAACYATSAGLSVRADARLPPIPSSCLASAAASAKSQSLNVEIFGSAEVALGHTIQ